MIRLARPWIGEREQALVREVIASGMLVQGTFVRRFEEGLEARTGRKHAVACGSGTAALEMALAALDIAGGEVLCPDLSWPSPAHAIVRAGATLRLVDVDPATWNASAEGFNAARTRASSAAIAIDQFGNPADARAIEAALGDIPLIVDAACSLGASLGGRPAGSFGRIACLSFHPRKLITTGEGGACLTDDDALAERLRRLRNHGQSGPGRFAEPAGNQRMTEVAAAMGIAQLERLDAILERRATLFARYNSAIAWATQAAHAGAIANHQTFGVLVPEGRVRDEVVATLRERGVEAGRLSYALHEIGSLAPRIEAGAFPVAERIDRDGVALPMHPLLTDEEQDRVIEALDG